MLRPRPLFDGPAIEDEDRSLRRRRRARIGGCLLAASLSLAPSPILAPDPARAQATPSSAELTERLTEARAAFDARRFDEAETLLRQAVELSPDSAEAWGGLSDAMLGQGRFEEALEASLKAVELADDERYRVLTTARLAVRLGQLDLAEALAERAASWAPAESSGLRSRVALARGDIDGARAAALASLDANPEWTAPALQVMNVYLRSERPQETLKLADEIEARTSRAPVGLNLMVGDALVQMGREADAVEWIEREIGLYPERPRAYGYLATLHGRLENPEEAGSAIDRLLATVPGPPRYVTAVRTLLQLGFPGEAVGVLRQGLDEYPSNPDLQAIAAALEGGE